MRIPACHLLTNQCDHWPLIHFVKWPRQEQHYVGRGMYERSLDFINYALDIIFRIFFFTYNTCRSTKIHLVAFLRYMLFWLVILTAKFSFAYFLQVGENEPFVSELLPSLPITIAVLEPHQIHSYESICLLDVLNSLI
ncbi:unnamed protein product [Trifolium pratense]|uniref:Uncharacterized protein n=1 Tax=Trifolium pratense TaxID=57577 RepID=A0ACB0KX38_TRIPR|nr:unnamed protein product [Trifolium pratense]